MLHHATRNHDPGCNLSLFPNLLPCQKHPTVSGNGYISSAVGREPKHAWHLAVDTAVRKRIGKATDSPRLCTLPGNSPYQKQYRHAAATETGTKGQGRW